LKRLRGSRTEIRSEVIGKVRREHEGLLFPRVVDRHRYGVILEGGGSQLASDEHGG
jgi:hypothetical protein